MNTGSILVGRPCLGSWLLYGLGSECENLPGYVVLTDYPQEPPGGNRNWSTGFMPATYQGTKFRDGKTPILHVAPPDGVSATRGSARKLDFIQQLNRAASAAARGRRSNLEARIASYELAYRMQAAAPEAVDLSERDGRDAGAVRPRSKGNRRERPQLPAGPPAGRARRALRAALHGLGQQVGRPHRRRRQPHAVLPRNATGRSPACSRISNSAACSTARW